MRDADKFIVKVIFIIVALAGVSFFWYLIYGVAEETLNKDEIRKAKIEMQKRTEIENGIRNQAVANGAAEYYLDENHEKKFRWLKAKEK